jgi:hypothetical protein
MDQLIGLLFLARDLAHREHLKTTSFAEHMALNDFYHDIIEAADELAEAYQGCFGELIGDFKIFNNEFEVSILDTFKNQTQWIKANRYQIVDQSETALHNLIDEVLAVYFKAMYKLKFLK